MKNCLCFIKVIYNIIKYTTVSGTGVVSLLFFFKQNCTLFSFQLCKSEQNKF